MSKPSTIEIVSKMLVNVAPRFREIEDIETFQAILPYRTVVVKDESSEMFPKLPDEYTEHRLYVMNGAVQLATVDLAFHLEKKLINFSFFIIPREWLKKKTVKDCIRLVVFPYLRQNYPDAQMAPQTQEIFMFPDSVSGLTFQLRTHLTGIGFAIIDSNYV